jgi:hypothetical protein
MNLEVERIAHVRAQGDERRVETFEMADLQQRAALLGGGDHPIRFFQRARDGLFDQHMNASREQLAADFAVRFGRHCEAHGINATLESSPVARPFRLSFGGNRTRSLFQAITDRDELRLPFSGERRMNARVLSSQVSNADDGCSQFCPLFVVRCPLSVAHPGLLGMVARGLNIHAPSVILARSHHHATNN